MNRSSGSGSGRDAATWLALLALLVVGFGLLFLTAMVMPQVLGIVLVVFGFLFFGAIHYIVWGWWLSGRTIKDDDESNQGRLP